MEFWQKNLEQTLKGWKYLGSEQIAMNMSVYIDELILNFYLLIVIG